MKIERINENQIKCTLTREDLVSRQMKLSELAYGSPKAKALFKELMEQAAFQVGFEAEDIPIMIEAVPLAGESIMLILTRVENPDEFDTRFSHFTNSDDDDDDYAEGFDAHFAPKPFNNIAADDILNMFNSLIDEAREKIAAAPEKAAKRGLPVEISKMFVFESLDDVLRLSGIVASFYTGRNSLYKNPDTGLYYLTVSNKGSTPEIYNKACNIIAEYGDQTHFTVGADLYMAEHYQVIVLDNALATLSNI